MTDFRNNEIFFFFRKITQDPSWLFGQRIWNLKNFGMASVAIENYSEFYPLERPSWATSNPPPPDMSYPYRIPKYIF